MTDTAPTPDPEKLDLTFEATPEGESDDGAEANGGTH